MTRKDPTTEPARQTPYRRLYTKLYSFQDNIVRQDECIGYLLKEIRALQKRVDNLEHRNDPARKLAYDNMEKIRELEQRDNLRAGKRGGQAVGRSAPTGRN